jgi:hypothetical protein
MARPKKQVEPNVEEAAVDTQSEVVFTKPEPIIITPQPIESLEVIMMKKRLLDEFEEAKALLKKKEEELEEKEKKLNESLIEDESVEETVVKETVSEEPIENLSVSFEEGLRFEVFDARVYIETVYNNSEQLFYYLEQNRKQLNDWIDELNQVPTDPNDLIFINFGTQQRIYRAYAQYFTQNGYAPRPPEINSWMEYYKKIHNSITDEEVAVELKGQLRYSFNPIK